MRLTLSLAFLSPAIVKAIMAGHLPRGIAIRDLAELPSAWAEQERASGCRRRAVSLAIETLQPRADHREAYTRARETGMSQKRPAEKAVTQLTYLITRAAGLDPLGADDLDVHRSGLPLLHSAEQPNRAVHRGDLVEHVVEVYPGA